MQRRVYQKSASHIHNHLNSLLSSCILMLCSNTQKRLRMVLISTLIMIFLRREYTITTIIVFDFGITHVPKPLLKSSLVHHRLICPKRNLILNPNETRCNVIIYRTTLKAPVGKFLAITLRRSTRSPAYKLISGHKISHLILVMA
jgi:hypothetical protein